MSENPKDYYMQGTFAKFVAGEDLKFLDLVELKPDKRFYLLEENLEVNYNVRGQMMESVKMGEEGNVMLHGFIIPKGEEKEHMRTMRRGAMLEIFSAIGEAFGFEVRPSTPTAIRGNDENG